MVKVEQMQTNQFIIHDGNKVIFQSYDSIIAVIDNSKSGSEHLTLGRNWDYSNTTARYLNQFLRSFFWCDWSTISRNTIKKAIKKHEITYDPTLV